MIGHAVLQPELQEQRCIPASVMPLTNTVVDLAPLRKMRRLMMMVRWDVSVHTQHHGIIVCGNRSVGHCCKHHWKGTAGTAMNTRNALVFTFSVTLVLARSNENFSTLSLFHDPPIISSIIRWLNRYASK